MGMFFLILFVIICIYITYNNFASIEKSMSRDSGDWLPPRIKTAPPRVDNPNEEIHWDGDGSYSVEIVGESNYQKHLSKLCGGGGCTDEEFIASLVLEDWNKYDDKAVCVKIGGETVGYLAKDDARAYRRRLARKNKSAVIATVDAIIVGGGVGVGDVELFYGVCLDMQPFTR